jgi:serine protease Do
MRRRTVVWYARLTAIFLISFLLESYTQSTYAQSSEDHRDGETTIDLMGLQAQFEKVADTVSSSVVAVSASEVCTPGAKYPAPDQLTPEKLRTQLSHGVRTVGTGFVIDSRGYILTNDHVVSHGEEFWITTDKGQVYPAMLVATDPLIDLAVLKTPANLPAVKFAAEPLHRGMWSIAVGNPYGLATDGNMALAAGVISAVDRNLVKLSREEHRQYTGLIQTTAEINPGNSGGPLIDIAGRVIGINVAVILPDKQTNGIGFAIPVDAHIMQLIDDLKNARAITHGYFGVNLVTPSNADRRFAGISDDAGAEIDQVVPGSPAWRCHLLTKDIVTSFNGEPVRDTQQLARLISSAPVDRTTRLMVFRRGQLLCVDIEAAPQPLMADATPTDRMQWNGMLLAPLPANWAHAGVIVLAMDATSPATKQGIHPGSIITGIAGKLIGNFEQFRQLVRVVSTACPPLQTTTPSAERVAASK